MLALYLALWRAIGAAHDEAAAVAISSMAAPVRAWLSGILPYLAELAERAARGESIAPDDLARAGIIVDVTVPAAYQVAAAYMSIRCAQGGACESALSAYGWTHWSSQQREWVQRLALLTAQGMEADAQAWRMAHPDAADAADAPAQHAAAEWLATHPSGGAAVIAPGGGTAAPLWQSLAARDVDLLPGLSLPGPVALLALGAGVAWLLTRK